MSQLPTVFQDKIEETLRAAELRKSPYDLKPTVPRNALAKAVAKAKATVGTIEEAKAGFRLGWRDVVSFEAYNVDSIGKSFSLMGVTIVSSSRSKLTAVVNLLEAIRTMGSSLDETLKSTMDYHTTSEGKAAVHHYGVTVLPGTRG